MKVYLVVNSPQYESSDIIAAYTDKILADAHVERMKLKKQRWMNLQRNLEASESEGAWLSTPPHDYDDLGVYPMTVCTRKRK